MKEKMPEGKYMSAVRVGPKGQIVIPKEVRDMFGIDTGDVLLLLADINRGMAINKMEAFSDVFDKAMPEKKDNSVIDYPENFKRELNTIKDELEKK